MHRPHRHFHREGREEGQPQPGLHANREVIGQQRWNVCCSGLPVHSHDGQQHQHRAEQRIEEELQAGIDAACATPNPDNQEHWDQAGFKEDVEQHDVERAEDADHQRFQNKERDHIFAHPLLDAFPARQDTERHQEGGQDHEQHRNAVDTEMVADAPLLDPLNLFNELEVRTGIVEIDPDGKRHQEGDDRCEQRHIAHVATGNLTVFPNQESDQRTDQRQESDDRKNGQIGHD